MHNPNVSENNCEGDDESVIELGNRIKDPESTEQTDSSTAWNVPELIQPTWMLLNHATNNIVTVGAMESGRNQGHKKT